MFMNIHPPTVDGRIFRFGPPGIHFKLLTHCFSRLSHDQKIPVNHGFFPYKNHRKPLPRIQGADPPPLELAPR